MLADGVVIHRFAQAAIPLFPLAWGLWRAVGVQEELPTVDTSGPLAVTTFMTSLRVALHSWLDAPGDTSLHDLVDRALAEAGHGFA